MIGEHINGHISDITPSYSSQLSAVNIMYVASGPNVTLVRCQVKYVVRN